MASMPFSCLDHKLSRESPSGFFDAEAFSVGCMHGPSCVMVHSGVDLFRCRRHRSYAYKPFHYQAPLKGGVNLESKGQPLS
jgi:hypothetical protein